MSLKTELQELELEKLADGLKAHDMKLKDPSAAIGNDDFTFREESYKNLVDFAPLLGTILLRSGFSKEHAELLSTGAALTIHTLIEVAEMEELPNL